MAKIESIKNPKADWIRVVNAARLTAGLKPIDHEPSSEFKRRMLISEHSPIRLLEYDIVINDVQQWITVHYVRHHIGIEKFVRSQRTDRNEAINDLAHRMMYLLQDELKSSTLRDYIPQGEKNTMMLSLNAQSFINISRKRLCKGCPSKETREIWELVMEFMGDIDPILVEKCVPECIYRGFCPEKNCCGYINTLSFKRDVVHYRSVDDEVWKDIKDHNGYQISNHGRIKHFDKILSNFTGGGKYDRIVINNNTYSVSRLVANAFLEPIPNKDQINHIDGNKQNNFASNLEWVTNKENIIHAINNELNNSCKAIMCIENNKTYKSIKECSEDLNIGYDSIRRSMNGETKNPTYHFKFITE